MQIISKKQQEILKDFYAGKIELLDYEQPYEKSFNLHVSTIIKETEVWTAPANVGNVIEFQMDEFANSKPIFCIILGYSGPKGEDLQVLAEDKHLTLNAYNRNGSQILSILTPVLE